MRALTALASRLALFVITALSSIFTHVFARMFKFTMGIASRGFGILLTLFPLLRVPLRPIIALLREIVFFTSWLLWLLSWMVVGYGGSLYVLVTAVRVILAIILFICVRALREVVLRGQRLYYSLLCSTTADPARRRVPQLMLKLAAAESYCEWRAAAVELDDAEGQTAWRKDLQSPDYDYRTLARQLAVLKAARAQGDIRDLVFALHPVFHREFCGVENPSLYIHARTGTKALVEEFYATVTDQITYLSLRSFPTLPLELKYRFLKTARKSMGRTALCLSGGGALAMYHLGVIKTLLENDCLPSVVSGTSGGSIVAAMACTRTDAELNQPGYLSPGIANRYGRRWLPSLQQQVLSFLRQGVLMDHTMLAQTCQAYFGDLTFEEAYHLSGRALNITVASASVRGGPAAGAGGAGGRGKGRGITLNFLTTPRVYVWSAVLCSCALPGLIHPQPLYAKDYNNKAVLYYPHGCQWADGTLNADIPVDRLAELFNVTRIIVCQVNPHVRPFMGNLSPHASKAFPLLTKMEELLTGNLSYLLSRLASVRAIPKVYGQSLIQMASSSQRYSGDITILPHISFWYQFKVLAHPSLQDMEGYISSGEQATWPYVTRIQNSLILEKALHNALVTVEAERAQEMKMISNNNVNNDGGFLASTSSSTSTSISATPTTTAAGVGSTPASGAMHGNSGLSGLDAAYRPPSFMFHRSTPSLTPASSSASSSSSTPGSMTATATTAGMSFNHGGFYRLPSPAPLPGSSPSSSSFSHPSSSSSSSFPSALYNTPTTASPAYASDSLLGPNLGAPRGPSAATGPKGTTSTSTSPGRGQPDATTSSHPLSPLALIAPASTPSPSVVPASGMASPLAMPLPLHSLARHPSSSSSSSSSSFARFAATSGADAVKGGMDVMGPEHSPFLAAYSPSHGAGLGGRGAAGGASYGVSLNGYARPQSSFSPSHTPASPPSSSIPSSSPSSSPSVHQSYISPRAAAIYASLPYRHFGHPVPGRTETPLFSPSQMPLVAPTASSSNNNNNNCAQHAESLPTPPPTRSPATLPVDVSIKQQQLQQQGHQQQEEKAESLAASLPASSSSSTAPAATVATDAAGTTAAAATEDKDKDKAAVCTAGENEAP